MSSDIDENIQKLEEKYRLLADNLIDTTSIERISGFTPDERIGMPVQSRQPSRV